MIQFLISLLVGALVGYVAGRIMNSGSKGLLMNCLIGIVGGSVGHFVYGLLGIQTTNFLGDFLCSVIGAIIVIFVARKISK